jgi:hypothetical protein
MEKKFKRNLRAKFAVFGLLFLLLLMLPSVHAAGTGNVISGTSVNAFEQAFGAPGLFVFFFFIVVAFIEAFFKIAWPIAIEMYLVTFAMVTVILSLLSPVFSFQILTIMWVMIFSAAGYGFTKIFADLIFA